MAAAKVSFVFLTIASIFVLRWNNPLSEFASKQKGVAQILSFVLLGKKVISLNELFTAPGNIVGEFNIASVSMLDALHRIEKPVLLKTNRTADPDVITVQDELSFIDRAI